MSTKDTNHMGAIFQFIVTVPIFIILFFYAFAVLYHFIHCVFRHLRRPTSSDTGTIYYDVDGTIASLPMVAYLEIKGKEEVSGECPVCLGAVGDEEMVKMLPDCQHLFHVECIDMWLSSHSTCPVCRSQVMPLVRSEGLV